MILECLLVYGAGVLFGALASENDRKSEENERLRLAAKDERVEKKQLEYQLYEMKRERERLISDIKEINSEVNKRAIIDGNGNELRSVVNQRENVKRRIQDLDKRKVEAEFGMSDSVDSKIVDEDNVHVFQYNIGQTNMGKKCPVCGRNMVLQFPRNKLMIDSSDIFWGCTGYYDLIDKCRYTERFNFNAVNRNKIFTKDKIEEFEINNEDLATIYEHKSIQEGASKRLRDYRGDNNEVYTCPTHGVDLVLKEKREFQGSLDQFYFSCPMDNCNYLVKIKSPAQLAAALKTFDGRGIL